MNIAVDLPHPHRHWAAVRRWRPSLRITVAALAFAVVLAMAAVIANVVAGQLLRMATASALQNVEAIVRGYVDPIVDEEALLLGAERDPAIDEQLERLVVSGDLRRIKVWSRDGAVVYSDDPAIRGERFGIDEELADAFAGESIAEYGTQDSSAHGAEAGIPSQFLEIYVPIRGIVDGRPIGVYEVYQDARPILERVDQTRGDVFLIALVAASVLLMVLWASFAGASRLLAGQNRLLRQRAQRDPLTDLANHGYLLEQIDHALGHDLRGTGGLALLDVDNFRLTNDGYGYRAGDQALLAVAARLRDAVSPGQLFGRYGPDEFLLTDFEGGPARLMATIEHLQRSLGEVTLRFDGSEALPLTVSVGVAQAPRDGRSALELIGVAEAALREAKTGGGSSVKVADRATMESLAAQNSTFGVFEGLVEIIDAKDHYTKFHSEDVTAHALFLADIVGLDEEGRRALRLAGLLHDVGKVGIPDGILRKPAPLTAAEQEIVKQHVSLGDAMVGSVPQLASEVRAGVLHHHERWDGSGYLAGLSGTAIPLTARLLAVADAYSAMTTTRPYRKALAPEEALRRITAAAGTQLDPDLAARFVDAMRARGVGDAAAARPTVGPPDGGERARGVSRRASRREVVAR